MRRNVRDPGGEVDTTQVHTYGGGVECQRPAIDTTERRLVLTVLGKLNVLQPKLQVTFELSQHPLCTKHYDTNKATCNFTPSYRFMQTMHFP